GRPLADFETARIAAELASALGYAHAEGVLHRDVKPTNVLFDSERTVKIADFGIARVIDAPTLTEAGTLLGTATYISPEQSRGEPVTPATDVYAFGAVLSQVLMGGGAARRAPGGAPRRSRHCGPTHLPTSSMSPSAHSPSRQETAPPTETPSWRCSENHRVPPSRRRRECRRRHVSVGSDSAKLRSAQRSPCLQLWARGRLCS